MVGTTASPPPNANAPKRESGLTPTPELNNWIDSFLTRLESQGFFDEKKTQDVRAILE